MSSDAHADPDLPHNRTILEFVIGTVVLLVVVVVALLQWFDHTIRKEIDDKVMSRQSSALRDLRAAEQAHLSRYQWVNEKQGIVRIPIDRAMALTLADWDKRPTAPVPVAAAQAPPAPTPAPASAPAPAPAPASAPAASQPTEQQR